MLVKIWSFFKNWLPLTSVTVSTSSKNLWTKENGFHKPENSIPLAGMKEFVEKNRSTRQKKTIIDRSFWKMEKKWFPQAKKSVVN